MTFPWPLTVMNTLFSQKKTSSLLVSVAPFSLALPLIAPSNPESALPQSLEVGVPGDPTVAFACPAHSHGSRTSQLLKNPNSVMLPVSAHSPRSHWYICCILGFLYLNAPKKSICSKLVLFLKSLPSFIPSSSSHKILLIPWVEHPSYPSFSLHLHSHWPLFSDQPDNCNDQKRNKHETFK